MKIYFCGSIRGGYSDVAIYTALIQHLKTHGEVLTEHVGDSAHTDMLQDKLTDAEIFQIDRTWLAETDVVVADCTTPSLGVGYEIGIAESTGKPVLCLFRLSDSREERHLSALIRGNPRVSVQYYRQISEAKLHIDAFLSSRSLSSNKTGEI